MLVRRGQHLVAGPELEAGQHAHDAVARAGRQRDVGRVGAEQARVRGALAGAQRRSALVDVVLRAPSAAPRSSISRVALHGRVRQRPARARRSGRPGRARTGNSARRAEASTRGRLRAPPPSADGPGRRAGARVEHRRAAILLGLGRRGGVAAAADARPGAVVELVLAAEGARRRRRRAGCRRDSHAAIDCSAPGTGDVGGAAGPAQLADVCAQARRSRRRRAERPRLHAAHVARGARGGGRRAGPRRARRRTSCSPCGARWPARDGDRRSMRLLRGRRRDGAGSGSPAARADGGGGAGSTAHAPHTARAASGLHRRSHVQRDRAARDDDGSVARPRIGRFGPAGGSRPRRSPPRERRREAGATPRRGRVSGPCDPAQRSTVAARHERSFASNPPPPAGCAARRSRSIGER